MKKVVSKKVLSVALVAMMVLSMSVCALAETWTHEASGITIELPDGMASEDISENYENENLVGLYVETGNESTLYYIYMEYSEEFDGMWMEDLSTETVEAVGEYYATKGKVFDYAVREEGDFTFLIMRSEDSTEAIIVALLNGWFISIETVSADDEALNDRTYEDIYTLLSCIKLPG